MAKIVTNGYPIFTDADGQPLEEGYIYIGIEGQNPLSSPQQAYWDEDLTVPATSIRTSGGYPMYSGSPGRLYTANAFSLLVQDKFNRTIYYQPTSIDVATSSATAATPDIAGGLPLGAVIPKNGVTFTGFLDLGTTGLNDSDYPDLAASGVDVVKDNGDGTFDLIAGAESTGWVQLADFTNANVTITHSLVKNMTDLDIEVYVSSAGTEATAIKVLDTAFDDATVTGISLLGIGNASFKMRIGTDGLGLINTDGTRLVLTNQNWYYKVDMRRKDLPYPGQISYVSNSFTVDGGSAATQIVALRVRRDSAANWSSSNPTLALGEAGYATDTDEFKIGDGATPWNSLNVINTGVTANLDGVIGTDRTFLELDGATVKVSVGSVIEADGTLYTVTGAAATPSGTQETDAYLFFDSGTGTYTWSLTAGTVDAAKGGLYDGSGRRQCRWRLKSSTTWEQVLAPESPDVAVNGDLDASGDLTIGGDATVTGSLTGGHGIAGSHIATNPTQNAVYDVFAPFLPNVDDKMKLTGALVGVSSTINEHLILVPSYVERTGASQMTIYAVAFNDSTGGAGTTSLVLADGSATQINWSVSLAW